MLFFFLLKLKMLVKQMDGNAHTVMLSVSEGFIMHVLM